MARIIPVGFGELSFVLTGGDGTAPYVTTLGVNLNGVAGDDYVAAANDAMALYGETIGQYTSDELQIERVVLLVGLGGGTSGSVESTLPPIPGANLGAMMPLSMAPIARKQTASLGRKGRGRSFLPGVLQRANVDEGGTLDPGYANDLGLVWEDLLTGLATLPVGGALAPVLLHNDGSTPSPIIGGSIAPKVGWIRDRIR